MSQFRATVRTAFDHVVMAAHHHREGEFGFMETELDRAGALMGEAVEREINRRIEATRPRRSTDG